MATNKRNINRWVFKIDLEDVQDEKVDWDRTGGCILCGKEIKKEKFCVHLLDSLELVSSDQDFEDSQGFFPVGSCCKGKLPNNFIFEVELASTVATPVATPVQPVATAPVATPMEAFIAIIKNELKEQRQRTGGIMGPTGDDKIDVYLDSIPNGDDLYLEVEHAIMDDDSAMPADVECEVVSKFPSMPKDVKWAMVEYICGRAAIYFEDDVAAEYYERDEYIPPQEAHEDVATTPVATAPDAIYKLDDGDTLYIVVEDDEGRVSGWTDSGRAGENLCRPLAWLGGFYRGYADLISGPDLLRDLGSRKLKGFQKFVEPLFGRD